MQNYNLMLAGLRDLVNNPPPVSWWLTVVAVSIGPGADMDMLARVSPRQQPDAGMQIVDAYK